MATKTKTEPKTETNGNKPVAKFRARGVNVAVFENKGDNGVFYKTTLQRVYREGEEWKTTSSLGRDDLVVARYLMQKAWEWILDAEGKKSNENTE